MKTTVNVARLVENLGVSAYLGAVTIIDDPELLTDAATILTVEARHQTIHNLLAGGTSISNAFDIALSPPQVLAIAGPFISGCDLGIPGKFAIHEWFAWFRIAHSPLCSQHSSISYQHRCRSRWEQALIFLTRIKRHRFELGQSEFPRARCRYSPMTDARNPEHYLSDDGWRYDGVNLPTH